MDAEPSTFSCFRGHCDKCGLKKFVPCKAFLNLHGAQQFEIATVGETAVTKRDIVAVVRKSVTSDAFWLYLTELTKQMMPHLFLKLHQADALREDIIKLLSADPYSVYLILVDWGTKLQCRPNHSGTVLSYL